MRNAIEKEYKILVTKEQFECLCASYENLQFVEQINTYYDTLDHAIEHMHGAMRIREKEDTFLFTLKMLDADGLHEHECEVSGNLIAAFDTREIKTLLDMYKISGSLVKVTTLMTKRAVVDDENAELCFDINYYNGKYDYEIEYEYKKEHDGRKKFNLILNKIQLEYFTNCDSKIKRALDSL